MFLQGKSKERCAKMTKKRNVETKATKTLKIGEYRNDSDKIFRGFTSIQAKSIQTFGHFKATQLTNIMVEGNVNTSGDFEGKNIEILGNQNTGKSIVAKNYYAGGSSKIWNNLICKNIVIVAENLKVRGKIECKLLLAKGNIEAQAIYSHGNDVYCGGKCTGILVGGGKIHENFKDWDMLIKQIEGI